MELKEENMFALAFLLGMATEAILSAIEASKGEGATKTLGILENASNVIEKAINDIYESNFKKESKKC